MNILRVVHCQMERFGATAALEHQIWLFKLNCFIPLFHVVFTRKNRFQPFDFQSILNADNTLLPIWASNDTVPNAEMILLAELATHNSST